MKIAIYPNKIVINKIPLNRIYKSSNIFFKSAQKDSFQRQNTNNKDIIDAQNKLAYLTGILEETRTKLKEATEENDINAIANLQKELAEQEKELKRASTYIKKLEENSRFAPLYSEQLTTKKKNQFLKNLDDVLSLKELTDRFKIDKRIISTWVEEGILKTEPENDTSNNAVIDLKDPEVLKFLEETEKELPDCISTNNFKECYSPKNDENLISDKLQSGEIKALGFPAGTKLRKKNYRVRINIKHPLTTQLLKELNKTRAFVLKSCYKKDDKTPIYIPVQYLVNLGFAQNKEEIFELIKKGKLQSITKEKVINGKKEQCTFVEIGIGKQSEAELSNLRDKNPNIATITQLAKELHRKKESLFEALKNEELKIIPFCIFQYDLDKLYINKKNPINKKYIEKITEENEKLGIGSKINDLNMQKRLSLVNIITWKLSPRTRATAKKISKGDKKLHKTFKDISEGNKLTSAQIQQIDIFHKKLWNTAGTEEHTEAFRLAHEYVNIYIEKGIDGIENQEIKDLILEWEKKNKK